jgi:RNA polymerase sigma-70 factor (ECF subfamily)
VDLERIPAVHGDLALAARCCAGDMAAFEGLYRTHAPRLYGLACRFVGRHEADDLLQDIFLTAHRKLASYKGDAALGTWLFRLATNLCVDHLRSRGARLAERSDPLEDGDATPAGSQAGPILGVLDRMDLERALPALSPGSRQVFVLHDVEGLEHREIAALLGISWGTSKSQLHKARRRLRVLMAAGRRPVAAAGG